MGPVFHVDVQYKKSDRCFGRDFHRWVPISCRTCQWTLLRGATADNNTLVERYMLGERPCLDLTFLLFGSTFLSITFFFLVQPLFAKSDIYGIGKSGLRFTGGDQENRDLTYGSIFLPESIWISCLLASMNLRVFGAKVVLGNRYDLLIWPLMAPHGVQTVINDFVCKET